MKKIGLLGCFMAVMILLSLAGSFAGGFSAVSVSDDKIDEYMMQEFDQKDVVRSVVSVNVGKVERVVGTIDSEKIEDYNEELILAYLTKEDVLRLSNNRNVRYVEDVKNYSPLLYESVGIVDADITWDLSIDGTNLTGEGQTIAIVDSGINFNHAALVGKNVLGGNAELLCRDDISGICDLVVDGYDTLGHGTHVAGIATANGDIKGIAPGANLVSLKVFSEPPRQGATGLEIMNALIWVREHAEEYNISVVSMSLGGSHAYDRHCTGFVETKVNQLNDEYGIASTIAVGNAGSSQGISSPSCAEKAIPVGATKKDDTRWSGSNYHELVKIFAPGYSILSTCRSGGLCYKTGTSMAAPMAAGAVAIINQELELSGEGARSRFPKEEIEPMLFRNAEEILNLDFDKWRRLNVYNVIIEMLIDQCVGDLNDDGVVDVADINIVLGDWGCEGECEGDVNGDGVVDVADIVDLLRGWGSCVEESEYVGDRPSLEDFEELELN